MTCSCAQDPGPSIRPYFRLEMHGVPVRRPRTHPHRTRQKKYSRRNGGTPSFGLPQTSREKYTHVRSASGVESLFHGRRPTDGAPCLIVPTFPPTRSKLCPWELFVGRTTVTKSKPKFSVAALLEVSRPASCPFPPLLASPKPLSLSIILSLIVSHRLHRPCSGRKEKKRTRVQRSRSHAQSVPTRKQNMPHCRFEPTHLPPPSFRLPPPSFRLPPPSFMPPHASPVLETTHPFVPKLPFSLQRKTRE